MGLEWWDGSFEGIKYENWKKHRHFKDETIVQKIRNLLVPWRAIRELQQDREEVELIIDMLEKLNQELFGDSS